MTRKPWDQYFMGIATAVSARATCNRKHVGAIIVKDKRVLATGYNGSMPGAPHCDDVGHMMEDGHCVRTVHAEANAINQSARFGVALDGATIYTTASPCWPCFQKIVSAGLKKIVFGELYRDERIRDFANQMGIELVDLSKKEGGNDVQDRGGEGPRQSAALHPAEAPVDGGPDGNSAG